MHIHILYVTILRVSIVPIFLKFVGKLLSLCVFLSKSHLFEAQTTVIRFTQICRTMCIKKCFCEEFFLIALFKVNLSRNHRILVEFYGVHALAERACQKWFCTISMWEFWLERRITSWAAKQVWRWKTVSITR